MELDWLIDGQQRVITLARTMAGDEGIEVVFNGEDERFTLASAATRRDGRCVPLSLLLDDEQYRRLRRNLTGSSEDERLEARFDSVRRILDYEVSFVRMVDYTFSDAVDAFKRINTLGVRLKQEDIESAQVASGLRSLSAARATILGT